MCSAGAAAAFTALGTGVAAYGAYQQGQQENDLAKMNARTARLLATDAEQRGAIEETRFRQKVEKLKGTQRAQLAASGVLLDSGSAADILEETAGYGELDALNIRANAAREAYGYRVTAENYRQQGRNARARARAEVYGGILSGGARVSSILSKA